MVHGAQCQGATVDRVRLGAIDMLRLHLILLIAVTLLSTAIGYFRGFVDGVIAGIKEGESNILMKSAGKCFKHIDKEVSSKDNNTSL